MRIYWFFIWRNLNPYHPRMLVPRLVKIDSVVLEKKMKMWKVYRQTDRQMDRQTDDGRQVIRKAHLSFQLRWAKKNTVKCLCFQLIDIAVGKRIRIISQNILWNLKKILCWSHLRIILKSEEMMILISSFLTMRLS